ncbi:MAG TPA: MBL fold metallo-hydrolase [Cellvibrionaceae bacterium]|nr:MBL fold metallo-hydrolase [Cellvibrionaceae bacterium]
MNKPISFFHALAFTALALPLAVQAASLQQADATLKAKATTSLTFKGTGAWYQFGQAPAPTLAWPKFDVSSYQADINFEKTAGRVQITRKQSFEPGRNRPAPTEQKADQYISDTIAWNLATTPPANNAPAATAQPAALEERKAEIISTPQGFIRAALANNATSKPTKNGIEVNFTLDKKYQYKGIINDKNLVESVQTWIDNPVLGDTLYETTFADYQERSGVQFPARISRKLGGHPILDISVSEVQPNGNVSIAVPAEVTAAPPAITVTSTKLAEGVYYLTGGTHHSVAIEQADHVVLVEAPQHEARSLAVIAKVKEILPTKPIKYLINTHAHFDHLGGVRTFVDAGATIVTHKDNQAYYQKIWQQPHSLNPDKLAQSKKTPKFATFSAKHTLGDSTRKIELYPLTGNSHNDAFAFIYLPNEKILIEADAYTPLAQGVPVPANVNPYSQNLYELIQSQKLDVAQIAALHGPGVVTLADLKTYIGLKS